MLYKFCQRNSRFQLVCYSISLSNLALNNLNLLLIDLLFRLHAFNIGNDNGKRNLIIIKQTWLAATLIRTCCPQSAVSEKDDAVIGIIQSFNSTP